MKGLLMILELTNLQLSLMDTLKLQLLVEWQETLQIHNSKILMNVSVSFPNSIVKYTVVETVHHVK